MLTEIYLLIRVFLYPACWFRRGPTSIEWDRWMRKALKDPCFEHFGPHTVKLNGRYVWIFNHPYASCSPYDPKLSVYPTRRTSILFRSKYLKALLQYQAFLHGE